MTGMIGRLGDRMLTRLVPNGTAAAAVGCNCSCKECRVFRNGRYYYGTICKDCTKDTWCWCSYRP